MGRAKVWVPPFQTCPKWQETSRSHIDPGGTGDARSHPCNPGCVNSWVLHSAFSACSLSRAPQVTKVCLWNALLKLTENTDPLMLPGNLWRICEIWVSHTDTRLLLKPYLAFLVAATFYLSFKLGLCLILEGFCESLQSTGPTTSHLLHR